MGLAKKILYIFRNIPSKIECSNTFGSQSSCQVIYSQFGLAIHQNDHQARRRFVEWAQNEVAVVPDFHKRILFSDEAHFWLNGYVNKQNCRIWSEANPQVYVETPLHPEKLTVWCALWAGGIIGPYFFKNDEGHNVTVNGDRYRAMIINFFIPELNNHDVQELWFQQDGATCHTARVTIDLLKDTFGDRLISRFGPVNWPPRSCESTPLDYFLWGYVKSLVYADKPQTLDHLEDNIRRVIADIRPQMLQRIIENWTSRLDYIRTSRGSPRRVMRTCARRTDHLIGTSAHASQRPMATYTGMGTVGPGPSGLLRYSVAVVTERSWSRARGQRVVSSSPGAIEDSPCGRAGAC
ncbi:putative DD41D transposase [Trichonephila clavipes]|nr:putative DD41D transposase [Trichonephila clavipes]